MHSTHEPNDEQAKLWNGPAARAWVEAQVALDQMFKPFEDLLVDAVSTTSGAAERGRVLDVGCGTGSTTLAVARRLGTSGRCVGIDISEPMIAVARARAEREGAQASFICGDAQTYALEPASFDMLISRFGVMFFDDPVRAFTNLRQAAKDSSSLCFAVWRSAAENPFMTTAERAAAPLLPNIPVRTPDAPGQFAFADQGRIHRLLQESGWGSIHIQPIDVACTFPEKDLVQYFMKFGPVGRALQETDERTRARVVETVRASFDSYVHGAEVRFAAACWLISARG
jgi:SAM-dependent methyltransferase